MPVGICKLCLQTKDLQDSHLIPRAMYKYVRTPAKKNPNPVVVGRRVTATTSKQVSDYVLCSDCEQLFNRNGENWMLRQVWNGKRFPLLERLSLAHQDYTFREALVFSGSAVGIDTDKLAYFALSVVWRAAVHRWATPLGGLTQPVQLGAAEEPTRRFLLGQSMFPPAVTVMATVCTDAGSAGSFYMPSRVSGSPGTCFVVLTLGVHFLVYLEPIPPVIREFCCVKSTRRLIFLRNCESKTLEAFAQLLDTSRPASGLV
jgi:hypothetical protein